MAYRKREDGNIWHWCKNCSHWPREDFDEKAGKPFTGELCNECQALTKAGKCTPVWL